MGNNNTITCSHKINKLIINGNNNIFLLELEGKLNFALINGNNNEINCEFIFHLNYNDNGSENKIVTKENNINFINNFNNNFSINFEEDFEDENDFDDEIYSENEEEENFYSILNNNNRIDFLNFLFNRQNNLINVEEEIKKLKDEIYSKCLNEIKIKNPKCTICLIDFNEKEKIKIFTCLQHIFHEDCIKNWLKNKRNCPVCRKQL